MHQNNLKPNEFLVELYNHLPVLVVRLTLDGMVLGINPTTTQVTGYQPCDLVGRNWWGAMYPGKLFRQVPTFISPTNPSAIPHGGLLADHPMTLRTNNGKERTIAWTRFLWTSEFGWKEIVLIGQDLTDRLTNADRDAASPPSPPASTTSTPVSESPEHSAAADIPAQTSETPEPTTAPEVEGEFIKPLAITPPVRGEGSAQAIRQVQQAMDDVGNHLEALEGAFYTTNAEKLITLTHHLQQSAPVSHSFDLTLTATELQNLTQDQTISATTDELTTLLLLSRQAQGNTHPKL